MISCSITEIIYNVLKNDEKNIKKYAFLETKTTRISFFYIAFHLGKFLWSLIHILVKTLLIKKINFRTEETNNLSHEIKININKLETILNKWNESGINTSRN